MAPNIKKKTNLPCQCLLVGRELFSFLKKLLFTKIRYHFYSSDLLKQLCLSELAHSTPWYISTPIHLRIGEELYKK